MMAASTPVKLKRYLVRDLFNAIKQMDGRPEVVKDPDGKVIGILNQPYIFDDAKPTYAFAKTRELIRDEVAAMDKAQQEIFKTMSNSTPEANAARELSLHKLMEEEVGVEVFRLPIAALKVHTNRIPGTVLCDLLPMLDGEI